jgi:hypothetical protein
MPLAFWLPYLWACRFWYPRRLEPGSSQRSHGQRVGPCIGNQAVLGAQARHRSPVAGQGGHRTRVIVRLREGAYTSVRDELRRSKVETWNNNIVWGGSNGYARDTTRTRTAHMNADAVCTSHQRRKVIWD